MPVTADTVRFNRYRIVHHAAECDCQNCGAPLYVGDRFIAQADQSPAFCGRHCAESHTGLTVSINGFVQDVGR